MRSLMFGCIATSTLFAAPQKLASDDLKPQSTAQPAGAIAPVVTSTPQLAVSLVPPGTTASAPTSFVNNTPLVIADQATQSSQIVVSGLGTYLWDVDLTTFITHTYAADLDITLTAPSGKIISITTDNGGGADDVFNGTVWDDSSVNVVTSYAYGSGVVAPDLTAEGSFNGIAGDNPNGTWTLTVKDDAAVDTGTMSSWSLSISTLTGTIPTPALPQTFVSTPNLPIPDLASVTDMLAVSGLGVQTAEVRLKTYITHPYCADLEMTLISPQGTVVDFSFDNGGANDDVFNGTIWYDSARSGLPDDAASNYPYVNLVTAPKLAPDGEFQRFWFEDPNGTWTLSVNDDGAADLGTLVQWELEITTWDAGSSVPTSYCTSGTTTNGCNATIGANANPSVSQANACVVTVSNVEGQKTGIVFYGISNTGFTPVTWCTGTGSSYLCVKAPTQRTLAANSGGTTGQCNGSFGVDWNAFQSANPTALGNPWSAGDHVFVQGWFRDPASCKTTSMSNAIDMTYQP